jgi:hypothetical protein
MIVCKIYDRTADRFLAASLKPGKKGPGGGKLWNGPGEARKAVTMNQGLGGPTPSLDNLELVYYTLAEVHRCDLEEWYKSRGD